MGRTLGARDASEAERQEMRRRVGAGEAIDAVARAMGRHRDTVLLALRRSGGLTPAPARSPLRLSLADREEISRGLAAGESYRAIARGLGRATSTISREVRANHGRHRYRAWRAERARDRRARRPRTAELLHDPLLRAEVEGMLRRRWSPEQIAATLRREHPCDAEMRVSHETIYRSLYVQGRGALRRELAACLRTGRYRRKPRGRHVPSTAIADMVLLSERPAEVEDRAVPGHWEGDLLAGAFNRSAIGTLVERRSRFVLLVALPDGHGAPAVREAIAAKIVTLPAELRRSLTWDRGGEMAEHVAFTVATGVDVYFCDPHSPWQRGSNENTNGLLRQYFPKGTDLSLHDQAHLDAVAAELNGRPRQTLAWMKPCEVLAEALR
jgi:transposase, IS30 family